jgi:hypothetical protein
MIAVINLIIFVSTLCVDIGYFRKDGQWDVKKGLSSFRFFTTLSNALSAIASLLMMICELGGSVPFPVWLLKYLGTAAVTVTLLTVFFFLGPTMEGGYKALLLPANNLYVHLIGPLLAIISFCFFEKGEMSFGLSLTGILPVLAYGCLYLYKIMYEKEDKRWEDFYGFNRGGKWKISFAAMMAGTFLVCMGIKMLG